MNFLLIPLFFYYVRCWDYYYNTKELQVSHELDYGHKVQYAAFLELHVWLTVPAVTYPNHPYDEYLQQFSERQIITTHNFRGLVMHHFTVSSDVQDSSCKFFDPTKKNYTPKKMDKPPYYTDIFYSIYSCIFAPKGTDRFEMVIFFADGYPYYGLDKKSGFYLTRSFFYAGELTEYIYEKWHLAMWTAVTSDEHFYTWFTALRRLKVPYAFVIPWSVAKVDGVAFDIVIKVAEKYISNAYFAWIYGVNQHSRYSDIAISQHYTPLIEIATQHNPNIWPMNNVFIVSDNANSYNNRPITQLKQKNFAYAVYEIMNFYYPTLLPNTDTLPYHPFRPLKVSGLVSAFTVTADGVMRHCLDSISLLKMDDPKSCFSNRAAVKPDEDSHALLYRLDKPPDFKNDAITLVNFVLKRHPVEFALNETFNTAQFMKNYIELLKSKAYVMFWYESTFNKYPFNTWTTGFAYSGHYETQHMTMLNSYSQAVLARNYSETRAARIKRLNRDFENTKKIQYLFLIPKTFSNPFFAAEVATALDAKNSFNDVFNEYPLKLEFTIANYGYDDDLDSVKIDRCQTLIEKAETPEYDISGDVTPSVDYKYDGAWSAAITCSQTTQIFDTSNDTIREIIIFTEVMPKYTPKAINSDVVINQKYLQTKGIALTLYLPPITLSDALSNPDEIIKNSPPFFNDTVIIGDCVQIAQCLVWNTLIRANLPG